MVEAWRVNARMGIPELMRDIHRQVEPVSVRAAIAFALIWFAAYMVDMAMASSMRLNSWLMRWWDSRVSFCFSVSSQIRAMAWTTRSGNLPILVSPDSMTASVPSRMALATSKTSARVGTGL